MVAWYSLNHGVAIYSKETTKFNAGIRYTTDWLAIGY